MPWVLQKNNSFEHNKIVILKTFDLNIRVLFRETYIRFHAKPRETFSQTIFRAVFFRNIEIVALDSWRIISEFINGNKNEKAAFLF